MVTSHIHACVTLKASARLHYVGKYPIKFKVLGRKPKAYKTAIKCNKLSRPRRVYIHF